jgi:secondary thiamine-phosphate synthase enzyme
MIRKLTVRTGKQGLYECTDAVQAVIRDAGLTEGLCTVFIQHTSASLVIQENADPSARRDLERWLARLVPEVDALYSHVSEGPDDMPAHIKAALTATSISIPVTSGRLGLGTWQGLYVWEHRHDGGARQLLVHMGT